jgi:hypothetical protein
MDSSAAEALVSKAFKEILGFIDEEDYDRCGSSALQFVKTYTGCDEAKSYLPYAEFFKLFADAYHTWQGSYHYTPIRGSFRMASSRLQGLSTEIRDAPGHQVVIKGLETLCEMLLEYTKCENSAINNDPFALKDHSQKAIELEDTGIACLLGFPAKQPSYLVQMAAWLLNYFQKNLYLHTGLNACAQIYSNIMRDHACREDLFWEQMWRAKEALDKLTPHLSEGAEAIDKLTPRSSELAEALDELTPQSSELSSELNAHIRHVHQHYARLMTSPESQSLLRVRSGKLVLSLSAACDRAGARRILDVDRADSDLVLDSFKDKVVKEFERLGFDADNIRPTQLVDIFETSFGENFLKSLTFDIRPLEETGPADASSGPAPPLMLTFLDKQTFHFNIRVTLSALGACTVSFEMEIDDETFEHGLSVEEIRVLESCICPHAGQVQLDIKHDCDHAMKPSAWRAFLCRWFPAVFCRLMDRWLKCDRTVKPFGSPARFLDRVNITTLNETIENLTERASKEGDGVLGKKVEALRAELEDYRIHALTDAHGITASDRLKRGKTLCDAVNSVIEYVGDPAYVKDLLTCCQRHTRLAEFAEELLGAVEQAFRAEFADWRKRSGLEPLAKDEVWSLSPDLGWYAYLYATRIDEVTTKPKSVRQAVPFSEIQGHADTLGFVIDQREARASFDDWRFMTLQVSPDDNLAHVRSHNSDAFYTSEFQTFFYFPDDPQYLVDQYEATVELFLSLIVGLRFYNTMAETLTHKIRKDEATDRVASKRMRDLSHDLDRVWRLRIEANELRNLVMKAGISRYQDHGKFMKRVLDKMNIETVADLTDRHLGQLEEASKDIIERLKASRLKRLNYAAIGVASFLGASATKDFFDAASERFEHPWTLRAMVIVLIAMLPLYFALGKPPSEK